MPINAAAWQPPKRAKLAVGPAPYTPPGDDQIVVKNRAVAINPVDWVLQAAGGLLFTWIKYPFVLGSDLAGEVVEVGGGVTRFKVGDRVLGHAVGSDPKRNSAAEGAFQDYTVLLAHMASLIPESLSFEAASVLPLGISTAACGLFQKDQLALDRPSLAPKPNGQTLIVWGGSTSVGANAIQLGVAAGYEVFATASPRNFDFVRRLGASRAFDYNSPAVVAEMIAALKGKRVAGAIAIAATSASPCVDIVGACEGAKFVSTASFPISLADLGEGPGVALKFFSKVPALLTFSAVLAIKARLRGVRTKSIWGSSLLADEVGPMIYRDFLPGALASGQYVAAPEPLVVGAGLGHVQTGFDVQKAGMSARKVVISL